MTSLSSKPRARPQTAREMQDELRAIFEERKRGSASMRSAPAASPPVEPAVPVSRSEASQRDHSLTPFVGLPLSSRTLHTPPRDDGFDDETRTDRKKFEVPARFDAPGGAAPTAVDEASADHPIRTVRPPEGVDIEIEVDLEQESQSTSRGEALTALLGLPAQQLNQDEETATMQLTPELRARIEQMSRSGAPVPVEDPNRPPPTRRMGKPPSGR